MKNYFDKIQDYLDGLLSQEEQNSFEKELSLNKELKDETQSQRYLNETIESRIKATDKLGKLKHNLKNNGKIYFSSSTADILKTQSTSTKGRIFSIKKWGISIAAAACLLIGLNFLGVFSANLSQLPAIQSEITRGHNDQKILTAAIDQFNAEEYKRSIVLFSDLLKKDSINVRFQYYLGLSYLGDKQFQDAADILISIADGNSTYAEDASYFAAIAAWQQDKNDIAVKLLKRISSESTYYKKAKKLLKKLS